MSKNKNIKNKNKFSKNKGGKNKSKNTPYESPFNRRKRLSKEERDKFLKDLGYNTYSDYLKSDLWALIKKEYLSKREVCANCEELPTDIFHVFWTVDNLIGKDYCGLLPLCRSCKDDKRKKF